LVARRNLRDMTAGRKLSKVVSFRLQQSPVRGGIVPLGDGDAPDARIATGDFAAGPIVLPVPHRTDAERTMKKLLLSMAITAGFAGSALAADMAPRTPIYKAPPPVAHTWTGCYIGAGGGYGMWNQDHYLETDPGHIPTTATATAGGRGWFGTAQAGCDYQFAGGFVIGVQGDHAWTNAEGSHDSAREIGVAYHSKVRSLATVTGRIGYAWDRFLGYVKGGGAWERDNYDRVILGTNVPAGSASKTRGGWTVGVGGEYAFTNFVSAFVEYNYYDFGNRTLTFIDPAGGFNDNINIRERKSVLRGGLNVRWGWGPVVAKY